MTQLTLFDTPAKLSRKSDPQTSQQSAAETEKKLGRLHTIIIREMGCFTRPVTANEIADFCSGVNGGVAESYRKRMGELLDRGLIEECGERRCEITGKNCRTFRLKGSK